MAIIKILSRHAPSYCYLIKYILNEGKTNPAQVITHNLRSNTIEGYVKEFAESESFRKQSRSDQVFLYHEVLSFNSYEDNTGLTNEIITDITREYIRLRGNEGVIIGAIHRDKGHIHVHLCVSALKFRTGLSFGLSKAKLREVKVALQEYHRQKYPQISQSFPEHGKGKHYLKDRAWQALHRAERDRFKEHIINTVQLCFAKATSQNQFLDLLRESGLHHYERSGTAAGIEYEGLKFRFSRLLGNEQFEALPIDLGEEEKALAEIRAIREQRQVKEREDRDWEDIAR